VKEEHRLTVLQNTALRETCWSRAKEQEPDQNCITRRCMIGIMLTTSGPGDQIKDDVTGGGVVGRGANRLGVGL